MSKFNFFHAPYSSHLDLVDRNNNNNNKTAYLKTRKKSFKIFSMLKSTKNSEMLLTSSYPHLNMNIHARALSKVESELPEYDKKDFNIEEEFKKKDFEYRFIY